MPTSYRGNGISAQGPADVTSVIWSYPPSGDMFTLSVDHSLQFGTTFQQKDSR
jgi:hypothetical protein